jgi:transposase
MPSVKSALPRRDDPAGELGALPQAPEDLRQFCRQLLAELSEQKQLVAKLTHELALFRRYLYGRRSEKLALDPAQLLLEFASWRQAMTDAAPAAGEGATALPGSPEPATPPRPRAGHGRTPLPAFLPRRRVEHALPDDQCTCRACGARLVKIGEETSEQLEYQPASLFVTEHVRVKYACQACEEHVVMSEMPAQPIDKGRPGPGLLAQVVTAKYSDHLPLNRQVAIFARHGVALSRQTLCDWVAASASLLEPVYQDLKRSVLASKVVNTDDTSVPVQDPDRTTTRDGYLWVYVADTAPADIVYDYTPSRSREGPLAFLGEFRGYLQADAFSGYDALYATGRVIEVGCMAHARRYFFEAKDADAGRALLALGFIQQLYLVEREGKGLRGEARRTLREEKATPIVERFKEWLDAQVDVVLPKSPIGEAVGYARGQWEALKRYITDGDLSIDNNVSERALRRVCVGRNNWLFCGSDEGGKRAAILYSLTATCKEHGIDAWAYLKDVLERIPTHPNRRRTELLPRNWKVTQAAAQQ